MKIRKKTSPRQQKRRHKKIIGSKYSCRTPSRERNRNFMVMELLTYVPEFRKDVSEIRKEFGIKEGGLEWDDIDKWALEKHLWAYSKERGGWGQDRIRKDFPSNEFEKKMFKIGTKYRLPFNFYALPYRGVPYFVLSGAIQSPEINYDIDFQMDTHNKTLLWASLIIYASLSKVEAEEMATDIRSVQSGLLPQAIKGIDIFAKKRYHQKIERDFILLNEQIARQDKPKKIKKFLPGSYLDILSKNKSNSEKELKKWERLNKHDVFVEYSSPTSKQIGKKQGVTGAAARQAKKRLNALAKELFGFGLEP